jgi:hypothetical protein
VCVPDLKSSIRSACVAAGAFGFLTFSRRAEDIAQAVLSKAQNENRSIPIATQEFLVRTLVVWMHFLGD